LQKAFAQLGYKRGDFPITETLSDQVTSLPMYPELKSEDIETVAAALKSILGASAPIFSPSNAEAVFAPVWNPVPTV
jgi:hypothetical protein